MKKIIFVILLLSMGIIVSACANKYVCSDGNSVSDPSLCKSEEEIKPELSNINENGVAHTCTDSQGTRTVVDECIVNCFENLDGKEECESRTGIHRNFQAGINNCIPITDTFDCDPNNLGNFECFFDGKDSYCVEK